MPASGRPEAVVRAPGGTRTVVGGGLRERPAPPAQPRRTPVSRLVALGRGRSRPAARLRLGLGLALLVAVLLGGAWLSAAVLAPAVASRAGRGQLLLPIAFGVAWFLAAGAGARAIARGVGHTALAVRITVAATALAAGAFAAYTTLRTTTVDETVVTGVVAHPAAPSAPAASGGATAPPAPVNQEVAAGTFQSLDESASGRAAVVRLAGGGRVLTLTGFSSSNGPDVRVYLVGGSVRTGSDVHDHRDLGGLKGNRGDQQYDIPADVDLQRYPTVVIYCRAFAVAFGAATLAAE